MVIRSVVHAVDASKKKLLTVFALNEFDPKLSGNQPWKKTLDTLRGQVLGTEIKGNNAKFTRWMTQTILAGADEMRLGFVTRANMASPDGHVVVGTHVRAAACMPSGSTSSFRALDCGCCCCCYCYCCCY